ncbi:MAG: PKD domain-containing protein [Bacteroidetes bacterium]|nr:PKD domain-containing protein [Bacteroidota bacterium]
MPIQLQEFIVACKNTSHIYTVYPNLSTPFTYTWTVTGGTPSTPTGNPMTILWGTGVKGYIKVVISDGGNCKDSIIKQVCLIDGPEAKFTAPTPVCVNTSVYFDNQSTSGCYYQWNFGDGTSSSETDPVHKFTAAGSYTVTLTATDWGTGRPVPGGERDSIGPCGCTDTCKHVIVVDPETGPEILTTCCFGTLCPGDTSTFFCASMSCSTYNWTATGGDIIPPANTSCIKVIWKSAYSGPTTVTLQGCPPATCPGPTTLNVPVIYPSLPIDGPTQLCVGASGSYQLPTLPGTYYTWTVYPPSGGAYAYNKRDQNTPVVNITFYIKGNYTVKCVYKNPLAGCNDSSTLIVKVSPIYSIYGEENICLTDSPTYTVDPGDNSTWSVSPLGHSTITVSGSSATITWNQAGEYTITATASSAADVCNTTAIKVVEVFAAPVLGPIVGDVKACPGENLIYTVSSNITGTSFIWTIINGTILSTFGPDMDSVIVKFTYGASPWLLMVTQNLEVAPGVICPSTESINILHYDPPTLITGDDDVCVDDIDTYTANGSVPPGGLEWSILTPNTSYGSIISQSGNNVTIRWHGDPVSPTINNVKLKVTNCEGSCIFTVNTISVRPKVTVTTNDPLYWCYDGTTPHTLTLTATSGPGYTYQWYPTTLGTSNPVTINCTSYPVGSYSFYVIVTGNNNCKDTSNIIYLDVLSCTGQGGIQTTTCDIIPDLYVNNCNGNTKTISLHDNTTPSALVIYRLWTMISGPGTVSYISATSNTSKDPIIQVTKGGIYNFTLEVRSSLCTAIMPVSIFMPDFDPITFCRNQPGTLIAVPNDPNYSYLWDFGDFPTSSTTSYLSVTQKEYTTNALSHPVTLTLTGDYVCSVTHPVLVDQFSCSIGVPATICPGGSANLVSMNMQGTPGYVYQWKRNDINIPLPNGTSSTYLATRAGKYQLEMTDKSGAGCHILSNSIFILTYTPPVAKITGERRYCADVSSVQQFYLSTVSNPSYSYSWTAGPNPTPSQFTLSNTNPTLVNITLPSSLPAAYQYIVTVTDNNPPHCVARDTICIWFYPQPTVTLTPLGICEGLHHILTPVITPATSTFDYLWSTGETTPTIDAFLPGYYGLTITDKLYGCSASASAGFIFPNPDLSLFPTGCDTICPTDRFQLYIPLPLDSLPPCNDYPFAYPVITWYDNSAQVVGNTGTKEKLDFLPGTLGNHLIHVTVTNQFNCTSTSKDFCLYVKPCTEPVGCDNCCKDFKITVTAVLEKVNNKWILNSTLATEPDKLYEIKAAIANFYMNTQAGCERCVTPTMDFGSLMPVSTSSNPSSQINWNPPSGPLINPIQTHYTTGDLFTSPREFVWHKLKDGQFVSRPKLGGENVGFQVVVPQVYPNKCCTDTIHFCIRYSFTDTTCRVCDTLKCFTIIQQYQGANTVVIQNESTEQWEKDLRKLEQNKQMVIPKKSKIKKGGGK